MRAADRLFGLRGQIAIVTGGASGIGEAIAHCLAELGATPIIVDCDAERASAVRDDIAAGGWTADVEIFDISSEPPVVDGVRSIVARHGPVHILVNNAGVQDREPMFDISAQEWDRIQGINLRGSFLMLRECAKAMVAGDVSGAIVNIASLGVAHPMIEGLTAYSASKAGLVALTRNAAFELSGKGIRVNAVLPGGVVTPGSSHGAARRVEGPGTRPSPLGQLTPPDIASAVAFLVSPAAAKITGQALAVESGWLLT
jgi:NAD(P)-dependent dehydrogenase (short-subunit alcohol dehydrogenase family)